MTPLGIRLALVVTLEATLLAVASLVSVDNVERWQTCTRYSARVSLAIFSLIVVADAHPTSFAARILSRRPYHLFACAHAIHLGFLLTYELLSSRLPPIGRLAFGMLGYVLLFAMPLIHSRFVDGRLSPTAWRRWRITYLSYVGLVMLVTYAARVFGGGGHFGGEPAHYQVLFAFVCALGVWRIAVALLVTTGILRRHDDPV